MTATDDRPLYRHNFRCRSCGNRFHVDRLTADPAKVKTPRCPRKSCGGKARESHVPDIGFDPADGRAPGVIGAVPVKAYDMALKMTAEDQQVTNIRDNAKEGENSVVPLAPHLQKQVDGFWGGGRRQQRQTRTARADLSPIFGERATAAQTAAGQMPQISHAADRGVAVEAILKSKPEGSSPVPNHVVLGSFNPKSG